MGIGIGKNQTFTSLFSLLTPREAGRGRRFPKATAKHAGGYTGEQLRQIRREKGVGRPAAHTLARLERLGWAPIHLLAGGKHPVRWARTRHTPQGPAARRRAREFAELLKGPGHATAV